MTFYYSSTFSGKFVFFLAVKKIKKCIKEVNKDFASLEQYFRVR